MDLIELQRIIEETFSSNFVAYYRTHVAHVNIKGRNFYQDHKLLNKIYQHLQLQIDEIAERIRAVRGTMPTNLTQILSLSMIYDAESVGNSEELLQSVHDDLDALIDQYHRLNDAAEAVNYIDVTNYCQDQIGILAKYRWQLEGTLEDPQLP